MRRHPTPTPAPTTTLPPTPPSPQRARNLPTQFSSTGTDVLLTFNSGVGTYYYNANCACCCMVGCPLHSCRRVSNGNLLLQNHNLYCTTPSTYLPRCRFMNVPYCVGLAFNHQHLLQRHATNMPACTHLPWLVVRARADARCRLNWRHCILVSFGINRVVTYLPTYSGDAFLAAWDWTVTFAADCLSAPLLVVVQAVTAALLQCVFGARRVVNTTYLPSVRTAVRFVMPWLFQQLPIGTSAVYCRHAASDMATLCCPRPYTRSICHATDLAMTG